MKKLKMFFKWQVFVLLLFFINFFPSVLDAKEIKRKFAVGMPPSILNSNSGKSISLKYFLTRSYGIQTILSYRKNVKETEFFKDITNSYNLEFRILKKLKQQKNINLYTGLGLSYGKEKTKSINKTDNSEDISKTNKHITNLILGVEYFFKEIKNLGFSAEIGYYFKKQKTGSNIQKENQLFSSLFGLHYYFK
jgi:hypothetical protein